MASRTLSAPQRTAIRAIHDGRGGYAGPTRRSLQRMGLVGEDYPWQLTAAGERAYEQIMASGDGPEDLKMRFAPIFRGMQVRP
jgi:hypothetical protein